MSDQNYGGDPWSNPSQSEAGNEDGIQSDR